MIPDYEEYWSWEEFNSELADQYSVSPKGPVGLRYILTGELPSMPTLTPEGIMAWGIAHATPGFKQTKLALSFAEWSMYRYLRITPIMLYAAASRAIAEPLMEWQTEVLTEVFEEQPEYVGSAGYDLLRLTTN